MRENGEKIYPIHAYLQDRSQRREAFEKRGLKFPNFEEWLPLQKWLTLSDEVASETERWQNNGTPAESVSAREEM